MGKLWKITSFNGKTMERSTIFNGKSMEHHNFWWENYGKSQFLMGKLWKEPPFLMGKLWKITIFYRKTMQNHHFYWEKLWKDTPFLMGKLWKDPPFLMGKLWKDPPFYSWVNQRPMAMASISGSHGVFHGIWTPKSEHAISNNPMTGPKVMKDSKKNEASFRSM